MIWKLTTFQYAGEFLKELYTPLHEQVRVNSQYISRIAKGLNRIMTGLLVEDKDRLILSTSEITLKQKSAESLKNLFLLNQIEESI